MRPTRMILSVCFCCLMCASAGAANPDPEMIRAQAAAQAAMNEQEPAKPVATKTTQVTTQQVEPQAQAPVQSSAVQTTTHKVVDEEKSVDPQYELIMQDGRGRKNTRVPALILDTFRGIVWTCQNVQDGRPLWVKTDLGQHGAAPMSKKRYVTKMIEKQEGAMRVPAVVLDTEEGVVWNCPNIIDANATWIRKNLDDSMQTVVR